MRHLKIVKWFFVPVFFLGIIAAAVVNFYNADYAKNTLDFFRARFLGGQSVEGLLENTNRDFFPTLRKAILSPGGDSPKKSCFSPTRARGYCLFTAARVVRKNLSI